MILLNPSIHADKILNNDSQPDIVGQSPYENETSNFELYSGWMKPPDYSIEPEPTKTITIDPTSTNELIFNFTLVNLGENTTFGFSVITPKNWTYDQISDRYYEKNTNSSADALAVTVYTTTARFEIRSNFLYEINLTVFNINDTTINRSISFFISINFWPYPKLNPPMNSTALPETSIIDCMITNAGTSEDNFEIQAKMGADDLELKDFESDGFKIEIYSSKYTKILGRDEQQVIQFKVTIPITANAKTTVPVRLIAISQKSPKHFDGKKILKIELEIGEYNSIILSRYKTDIKYQYKSNDAPNLVNLTVTNIGNHQNNNFFFEISQLPDNWTLLVNRSNIPDTGLVQGGSAELFIEVLVPKTELAGDYVVVLSVIGKIYSEDTNRTEEFKNDLRLNIQVPKIHNINISILEPIKNSYPGDDLNYTLRIENRGNIEEILELDSIRAVGSYWDYDIIIQDTYPVIKPFHTIHLKILITLNKTIKADPIEDTKELEKYSFELFVSYNDDLMDITHLRLVVEFGVIPVFDFEIKEETIEYQIIRHSDLLVNSTKNLSFNLNNLGNYLNQINLTVNGPDWVVLNNLSFELNRGESKEVFIVFKFNEYPNIGNHMINVTGRSVFNETIERSIVVTVKIADYDITIPLISVNSKQVTNVELSVNSIQQFKYWININCSNNYQKSHEKNIQVKVFLITGNGSFIVLDAFKIDDQNNNFSKEFTFFKSFTETGMFIILVRADLENGSRFDEVDLDNNKNYITINVKKDTLDSGSEIFISFNLFVMLSIIIIILIIVSLFLLFERTRYNLIKRLIRPEENDERLKRISSQAEPYKNLRTNILTYIRLNPGTTYSELRAQQELPNIELVRYLETFKHEKFIITKPESTSIRFYPTFSETKKP